MADHDFNALVKKAVAAFNAMSPEEQAAHREAQRQSWVRGETGMGESAAMVKPMTDPTDRQRAEAKARTEAWDFLRSYSGCIVLQPTFSVMLDGLTAVLERVDQRARREGRIAGREEAAKECNLVADDWRDAGIELKAFAADYLAAHIRTLPTPEEK